MTREGMKYVEFFKIFEKFWEIPVKGSIFVKVGGQDTAFLLKTELFQRKAVLKGFC